MVQHSICEVRIEFRAEIQAEQCYRSGENCSSAELRIEDVHLELLLSWASWLEEYNV